MVEPIFNNLIIVLLYRWLLSTCDNCNLCDADIYDEIDIEN